MIWAKVNAKITVKTVKIVKMGGTHAIRDTSQEKCDKILATVASSKQPSCSYTEVLQSLRCEIENGCQEMTIINT